MQRDQAGGFSYIYSYERDRSRTSLDKDGALENVFSELETSRMFKNGNHIPSTFFEKTHFSKFSMLQIKNCAYHTF